MSKGKKITKNVAEIASSISNFNNLAQRYLETIVALTNSSNMTNQSAIDGLREQSRALLSHLKDNAELLTPEERIRIIEQSAEITRQIAEAHKRGLDVLKKAMELAGGALLLTATVLIAFIQSQADSDNDRDTIDMDDYN